MKHEKAMIDGFEKQMKAETAFLEKEGWSRQPDESKKTSFIAPDGKEYEWRQALYKAVQTCIYRDNWFPVIVHTTHSRSRLEDNEFCYYAHKKYDRLFFYGDLSECYIHEIAPGGVISLIAKRYFEIPSLKNLKYVEGMWIKVDMWVENSKACYKLLEIGDWREKDKTLAAK
jgi:hypothetical protein